MTSLFSRAALSVLACAGLAHGSVIDVGGTFVGWTGIEDDLSEGWSMNFSDTVSISVGLENGNPPFPATGNTAYLTSGTSPSLADIVASTDFTLPGTYDGTLTLFSDVTLNPGSYWLIFSTPGPPASYANWTLFDPADISTAPGAQFLGYSFSFDGGSTFVTPITPESDQGAYQLDVSDVPEPSSLVLALTSLAGAGCFPFLSAKRRRRTRQ
jgi:hypothetical protein